ncbi:uncharacterized protein [Montipora foliosa]|uniref:uncharacterized protein n=1 Tax=Montipora foliosa TaxID=591990 RepID=UPI0035F1A363
MDAQLREMDGGLEGVLYANTLDGASNTLEFLNFFDEATKATQINGNPVFMAGDILVLDNCAIHRNAGGFALGQWLDTMGIDVVYLPTYSPELNPVEFAFNKLKIALKMEEIMRLLVEGNLHAAVYSALDQILRMICEAFTEKLVTSLSELAQNVG